MKSAGSLGLVRKPPFGQTDLCHTTPRTQGLCAALAGPYSRSHEAKCQEIRHHASALRRHPRASQSPWPRASMAGHPHHGKKNVSGHPPSTAWQPHADRAVRRRLGDGGGVLRAAVQAGSLDQLAADGRHPRRLAGRGHVLHQRRQRLATSPASSRSVLQLLLRTALALVLALALTYASSPTCRPTSATARDLLAAAMLAVSAVVLRRAYVTHFASQPGTRALAHADLRLAARRRGWWARRSAAPTPTSRSSATTPARTRSSRPCRPSRSCRPAAR